MARKKEELVLVEEANIQDRYDLAKLEFNKTSSNAKIAIFGSLAVSNAVSVLNFIKSDNAKIGIMPGLVGVFALGSAIHCLIKSFKLKRQIKEKKTEIETKIKSAEKEEQYEYNYPTISRINTNIPVLKKVRRLKGITVGIFGAGLVSGILGAVISNIGATSVHIPSIVNAAAWTTGLAGTIKDAENVDNSIEFHNNMLDNVSNPFSDIL